MGGLRYLASRSVSGLGFVGSLGMFCGSGGGSANNPWMSSRQSASSICVISVSSWLLVIISYFSLLLVFLT